MMKRMKKGGLEKRDSFFYFGLSFCAQFLEFMAYRSKDRRTDGQTDRQLIAAGLRNLQLVEDKLNLFS